MPRVYRFIVVEIECVLCASVCGLILFGSDQLITANAIISIIIRVMFIVGPPALCPRCMHNLLHGLACITHCTRRRRQSEKYVRVSFRHEQLPAATTAVAWPLCVCGCVFIRNSVACTADRK